MKKLLFSMLVAAAAITSCTKDVTDSGASSYGQEVDVAFTVEMPTEALTTRAAYAQPTLDLNLYLIVSYDNKVVDTQEVTNWDGVSTDLQFRLVTGQEYTVSAWADFGTSYYTVTNTVGEAPSVKMASTTINGSVAEYDAYFAVQNMTFTATSREETLSLTRPFAQVQIHTTDYQEDAVLNAGLQPTKYQIDAVDVPTSLDLLTGIAGDEATVIIRNSSVAGETSSDDFQLSFDYFFASDNGELLTFTSNYYADAKLVTSYDFAGIPVKRNYITNVSGNILTKLGQVTVSVDDDWSDTTGYEITEVNSFSDLTTALKSNPSVDVVEEVIGQSNEVELSAANNTEELYSINLMAGIASDATLTITGEDYAGQINIVVPEGEVNNTVSKITINATSATVTINGMTIADIESGTGPNTLIITANSEITGLLTVTYGNVDVYGKVNQITRTLNVSKGGPATVVSIFPGGEVTNGLADGATSISIQNIDAGITLRSTGKNYASIKLAVDAVVAGVPDEIILSAGTYSGSNIINNNTSKTYTISGPNKGISGTAVDRVEEAIIVGDIYRTPNYMNLLDITFDGLSFVNTTSAGFDVDGGSCNFTLKNSIVKGPGKLKTSSYGSFIYVNNAQSSNASALPSTFTIEDNWFVYDNDNAANTSVWGGIYLNACSNTNTESSMKAVVKNNKLEGTYIKMNYGGKDGYAIFEVDNNEIDMTSTTAGTGDYYGIMISWANSETSYTITNNSISNYSLYGIYVYDSNSAAKLTESDNTFSGGAEGSSEIYYNN